jgi:hypothetical protein
LSFEPEPAYLNPKYAAFLVLPDCPIKCIKLLPAAKFEAKAVETQLNVLFALVAFNRSDSVQASHHLLFFFCSLLQIVRTLNIRLILFIFFCQN